MREIRDLAVRYGRAVPALRGVPLRMPAIGVVAAVAFLLAEQSSWITGQTLDVDGGVTVVRQ